MSNPIPEWQDAFGKQIADGTRNTIDIPSIYDFNSERLRLFLNGSREEPPDVSSKFTDGEYSFNLEPAAGDTFSIQTAERPRYIVGYDSSASTAARVPSGLGSGDTHRLGLRDRQDPENKIYFEINGDSDNRVVIEKEGSENASETWTFPDAVDETNPIRYEVKYNAYNVGRYNFNLSFTDSAQGDNGLQQNEDVANLAVDDEYATGDFNHHIFQELDVTNSGVELKAGSFGFLVFGNVEETTRTKASRLTDLSYGGSGDYEPLAAARVDPSRGNVYAQFKRVTVFPQSGGGELLVSVFEPDETDASGFSTPVQQNPTNTVIQETESVTEFTDQDGNTVTSATNPNGYQVGFTQFSSVAQQGNQTRTATSQSVENKRPLYEDDVAVFLYKSPDGASDVNITYLVEQDW